MVKIAVLDDYQGVALSMADWDALPGDAQVDVYADHLADEDEVAKRLSRYEIVVAMRERTPFPRSLLERMSALRLLVTTGMGNASIDLDAASEHGVTVCGTEGVPYPTAQLTWGLFLALARHIPREDAATRDGRWQVTVGEGLHGKTLGLLGLGRLGSQVAAVGAVFGMQLIAWNQNLTGERARELNASLVTKDELLSESDFVTIHLVLSDRTRGLIGARELGLMKPTAYLVNTSRGPIVDESALAVALGKGAIAGAGLDVFDVEPLPPGHPLLTAPNTVLTPHLGYVTRETYRVFFGHAVEDIVSYLDGNPVRVIASPARSG